jgi:hypothetical protein
VLIGLTLSNLKKAADELKEFGVIGAGLLPHIWSQSSLL